MSNQKEKTGWGLNLFGFGQKYKEESKNNSPGKAKTQKRKSPHKEMVG